MLRLQRGLHFDGNGFLSVRREEVHLPQLWIPGQPDPGRHHLYFYVPLAEQLHKIPLDQRLDQAAPLAREQALGTAQPPVRFLHLFPESPHLPPVLRLGLFPGLFTLLLA